MSSVSDTRVVFVDTAREVQGAASLIILVVRSTATSTRVAG